MDQVQTQGSLDYVRAARYLMACRKRTLETAWDGTSERTQEQMIAYIKAATLYRGAREMLAALGLAENAGAVLAQVSHAMWMADNTDEEMGPESDEWTEVVVERLSDLWSDR